MLHKSGINLESNTIEFVENNESVTLFSAYLKLAELKLINQSKKINRIVVRWEIQDLCLGVSDVELFHYCLENKITLYRNTRIHLKAFWNNAQDVVFGSANVTGRGVGEKGRYNYELNGTIKGVSFNDIAYFNDIILNSEYVTKELYKKLKNIVEQTELPTIEYPTLETKKHISDYFLLSNLPMAESIEKLYLAYRYPDNLSSDEINYSTHDIVLYNIPSGLDETSFYNYIKNSFNSHPFILRLKEYIKSTDSKSLRYGDVVRWIQKNTTTVPIPRVWEIKKEIIVNILYSWICDLDDDYYWDVPGSRSQVIYFREDKNNFEEFIDNLQRDKARGRLAPHQIILLIAISSLIQQKKSNDSINISELIESFDIVWKKNQSLYKTTNNNPGMPIKAFIDRGYLEVKQDEDIFDFRNRSELNSKIKKLIVSPFLYEFLNEGSVADYLKSRIII